MPFEVSYTKHRSRSPPRTRVRRSKSFGGGGGGMDSPVPTVRIGASYNHNHHGHRHHHSISAGLAAPAPPPSAAQPSWSHHFQPQMSYGNTSTALALFDPRSSTPNMPGAYPSTSEQQQQVTRENYWRYYTPSSSTSTALATTTAPAKTAFEYTAPLKFSKEESDKAITQHMADSRRATEINAKLAQLHADLESERRIHSLDNSLQQTKLRQQILELELLKTQQLKGEVDAKNRMDSLYQLSQWDNYYHNYQQQQQQHHHHYLAAPPGPKHRRSHSHGARSRSRGPGDDEKHRSQHQCGRCLQRGHYSNECKTVVLTHMIDYRPARSRSRAGSVRSRSRSRTRSLADWASDGRGRSRYDDDDSYDDDRYDDDDAFYSDEDDVIERRRVVGVRGDAGILVAYSHGGGPGSARVRSEIRHVVGG